jgi:hypothetical protein
MILNYISNFLRLTLALSIATVYPSLKYFFSYLDTKMNYEKNPVAEYLIYNFFFKIYPLLISSYFYITYYREKIDS